MQKLGVKTVAELQAVPMEEPLTAVTTSGRTTPDFGPVVDGSYCARQHVRARSRRERAALPVMVGSNKDEHALYAREHPLFGKT